GVVDRVNFAHAPRLAHVGAAGEHAAVEVGLDADDPQHGAALAQRMLAHLADRVLNLLGRAVGADTVSDCHADRHPVVVEQLFVALHAGRTGVAVDDASQADGIVILEEFQQTFGVVRLGGLAAAGLGLDVAGTAAKDTGRLAGPGVLFGVAGTAVGHL